MKANFVDLMYKYPVANNRLNERKNPTEQEKQVAKEFGREFFDGDRKYGYGGFSYNPKYWTETVQLFIEKYDLNEKSSVLDVGCGKGFMLVDLLKAIPTLDLSGIDISNYAIENSHESIKNRVKVANCLNLPFEDNSFDLVISINTIHNLDELGCVKSLQEIERVKKKHSYIVVDGWSSPEEERDLKSWVLTAVTVLHTSEWEKLFEKAGYTGDYSFWKVS
jgi:ubiquinone/menaquinone biosynthesis C-methylase UbiE